MSFILNPQQKEAINYLDGPLLVLAGAGSGKTRVITQKIAYLILECGYQPKNVGAITFTNKAAKEMQERIGKALSRSTAEQIQISTFHSLGVRILREEAKALGYKPRFSIFDSADCGAILADLAKTVDKNSLKAIQSIISNWKNGLITPEMARHHANDEEQRYAAEVYLSYEGTLQAYQAVDFDDLIGLPVKLFTKHPELANKWQNRLRYLLIDEYQDTNACQYELLKLLTGPRAQFTAVGDDDQAIYGWRGADIGNLRKLPTEFPRLKVIKLEQNYRSSIRILKAANNVIAHNEKLFDKKLWSELGLGTPITVNAYRDAETEAESVVLKIQAHRFETRGKLRDYAILYRSNHQARIFEQQLRQHRIPYLLSGGQSFFDKSEIKDIIAYLRLLANEEDDPAFIRSATTPKRGIGATTLHTLGQYAGERHISLFDAALEQGIHEHLSERQLKPLTEFVNFIQRMQHRADSEPANLVLPDLLKAIDYEGFLYDTEEEKSAQSRWANVCEFAQWINGKGEQDSKTLIDLSQSIALINMLDKKEDPDFDGVQLSTLHASKGLEYKTVFLVGVEEGILPHRESQDALKLQEERRLMYVGITRAQQNLHISYCERRKQQREFIPCDPSRFIAEMGKEDIQFFSGRTQTMPDKQTGQARLANLKAMLNKK